MFAFVNAKKDGVSLLFSIYKIAEPKAKTYNIILIY